MHIDIKHLPQMPDEEQKRYLYVAIDRATRWVYLEVRSSQSSKDAQAFMKRVEEKAPFKIQTVLTDNGKSFTGRFTRAGERKPSGYHPFDQACQTHGIEHRLIKPGRPQTNGMVERFNGRISDVLATRRYTSGEDLEQTLKRYTWLYNHHIPQKALHHQTPIAVMKEWQIKCPELFTKKVVNHTGPETYALNPESLRIKVYKCFIIINLNTPKREKGKGKREKEKGKRYIKERNAPTYPPLRSALRAA